MRYYFVLLMLALLSVETPVRARELTLQEALRLAREHSWEVRRMEAEAGAADAAVRGARSARYPSLDATSTAFYNTETAELALETPVGTLEREVGSKENYQTDLRITFPLWTGGRISSGIASARASARHQGALVAAEEDATFYETRVQYLTLFRMDREIAAAEASLRRAELIVERVASLLEAGAADSVAVLEAALAVNEAEFRRDQTSYNRRKAEIQLLQLLGLPPDEAITVVTEVPRPSDPERLAEAVVRPELLAAEAGIALGRAQTQQASAEWWPSLAAFGGYSAGQPNLDRFNNTFNDFWQIGARLEWDLNLGLGTKHAVRRAEQLTNAAQFRRDNLAEQLRSQELVAWENVELAFAQYETARDRQQITARTYGLAEVQHGEGTLTSNRLLEIEATLAEAEAALAAAEAGFHIARSAYYYAAGSDKLMEGF